MTADEAAWCSYFFPETYNPATGQGVLRNLFGERDPNVLWGREYVVTALRFGQLTNGTVSVPRTFDAAHLRAIHRYLFQDVYDWAGQFRTVNIFKGAPSGFADVASGEIDRYLADVHEFIESTHWDELGREEFVAAAARVFAYVNQAHPFREGNGRASKVFMLHLADRSRFSFDFELVPPQLWNEASMYSGPDRFGYEPHPEELVPVFDLATVEE